MDREKLVEAMAESAHDAWLAAVLREGFTSRKAEWGEEFMVPFGELSERGKEFDRVIMRAILGAFDRMGFEVREGMEAVKEVKVTTCEDCPFMQRMSGIPYQCKVSQARARSHMLPLDCPLKEGEVQVSLAKEEAK